MEYLRHVFSIAQKTNPLTGRPFGDKYDGAFTVRRPSIGDKLRIELKDAAALHSFGAVNPNQLAEGTRMIGYAFATLAVIGEEKPEWFDMERLHDESDEMAVLAVLGEVTAWIASFRGSSDSTKGG